MVLREGRAFAFHVKAVLQCYKFQKVEVPSVIRIGYQPGIELDSVVNMCFTKITSQCNFKCRMKTSLLLVSTEVLCLSLLFFPLLFGSIQVNYCKCCMVAIT